MFAQLKNGFAPNGSISEKYECDGVRYEAVKLSTNISGQVKETGTVDVSELGETSFSRCNLSALAEVVTAEMLYYHQLGEIGCYIACAYSEETNENGDGVNDLAGNGSDSDVSSDDDEPEEEPHMLTRTASCTTPVPVTMQRQIQPPVNQLSANLLIASGRVRQAVLELANMVGVSVTLFNPASFQSVHETDRRYYHGLIVHEVFVSMGGKSSAYCNGEPYHQRRAQMLDALCKISKMTWTLMNLCAMTNTFRFMTDTPLFKTVKIDPIESVFGNNGWRPVLSAATTSPDDDASNAVLDSDDVPSSVHFR